MTAPVRLQLSRKKGFSLQALSCATNGLPAIVITRPGKYRNPFRIGGWFRKGDPGGGGRFAMAFCEAFPNAGASTEGYTLINDAATAVEWFGWYVEKYPAWSAKLARELIGNNVACVCKADDPCHGDVWLELARKCEAT